MQKWEYLTMVVNSFDDHLEDKLVLSVNGKDAATGKDFFDQHFPSFYERINSAGQEGWELAGIEICTNKRTSIYVFKRQEFPTRTVTSGILFLSNAFLFGEHSKQCDLMVISLIVSPNRSLLFNVEVASVQLLQQRLDRL